MARIIRISGAVLATIAMLVTPVAARGLGAHQSAKSLSVRLVLDVGGVNDKSFNHLAYTGMLNAEKAFGYSGRYIATQEQSQYVPNLTAAARTHPTLVIATGGLMSQAILTVAKQFPKQHFAIIDGQPADANFVVHEQHNVADLLFREQQSGFLVGVIAGLMEKNHIGAATHNTIGAMGGLPVPAVIRYIAGYYWGAKKVDPSITVKIGFSQSFTDQGKGNSVGRAQIAAGADILFQVAGGSGLGYLRAAQQAGKYGIGVDADQGYLGKYILTSAIKRVDLSVYNTLRDLAHGYFRSGPHIFNAKNGGTGFAPVSSIVPKRFVAIANSYYLKMKSGALKPPTTYPTS
ncbi:MAG TPA: BMP family ABC transporter substrate-binding protein [Chloroflexota bacterium]|nr:BMP family ABC transporter substrate-binding protein [Chloroflexota bacterium]